MNALQQGTLFTLLILGHAVPIHAIIAFLRALSLRSLLKVNSIKRRRWQATTHRTILHIQEKQAQKHHDTAISAKLPSPVKTHITGREIHADLPSPDESRNSRHFIIITNPSYPCQGQQFQSTRRIGQRSLKSCLSWIVVRLQAIWPQIKSLRSSSRSIDPDEPGWVEYKALILISVSTILYTILFFFIGILTIALWLKLCRPDIPQADGVSPVWAGTFLATSAFVNNGMSLIDANMAPFQREYVSCPFHLAVT